jgi:hypothetical protein
VLYDPDWLSFPDARERLKAKGAEATEAEIAICLALRDRKLNVHVTLEKVIYGPTGETLDPTDVRALESNEGFKFRVAMPDLKPADIDWDNSRPKAPWPYGPWEQELLAHVARIEVSRADLEREFPMLKATPLPPAEADGETPKEASPSNKPNLDEPDETLAREKPQSASIDAEEAERLRRQAVSESNAKGGKARGKQLRDNVQAWKTWVTERAKSQRSKHKALTQEDFADFLIKQAQSESFEIPERKTVVEHLSHLERDSIIPRRARSLSS